LSAQPSQTDPDREETRAELRIDVLAGGTVAGEPNAEATLVDRRAVTAYFQREEV
jgi:hypothetical protein